MGLQGLRSTLVAYMLLCPTACSIAAEVAPSNPTALVVGRAEMGARLRKEAQLSITYARRKAVSAHSAAARRPYLDKRL
jgi:hypothetical protein